MDSITPQKNYVGQLQEKCVKVNFKPPEYIEEESKDDATSYKFLCVVEKWKTEGVGFNKKVAKQNAAFAMMNKLDENLHGSLDVGAIGNSDVSSISKIMQYCMKEKKNPPLFADKPKENEMFVVSCTLDDFSCDGTGHSKKIAKEKAAKLVADHFGVHKYFQDIKKLQERNVNNKCYLQRLNENCLQEKLSCIYKEEMVNVRKKEVAYVVTCIIGELKVTSKENSSKKRAKEEAAYLMLELLKTSNTKQIPDTTTEKPTKRTFSGDESLLQKDTSTETSKRVKIHESSSDDE